MDPCLPSTAGEPAPPRRLSVCLVGPPTETDFDSPELMDLLQKQVTPYAPIGILSLAAVLERDGYAPIVLDLNQVHREYLASPAYGTEDFCSYAARRFDGLDCDLFGFSTICGSYPLTLRIAERVKTRHPDSWIVLGGPQATVVDGATLDAFPFVDIVVRGEAEETLPRLLECLAASEIPAGLPGITFRSPAGVTRNPNAPVIADLDTLPLPAFHLYADKEGCRFSLELGRGCPFACTFCSTNDFFRRNFRLKSPERMLEDMRHLAREYGVTVFDLVHDMFTVNRKKVVRFCEVMLASGEGFLWSCSARTDCVDRELIDLMHKAGCRGIFFGIETGSQRLQRVVKKNLDLVEAANIIEYCNALGIRATASLITGFPDETMADVRDTTGMLADLMRFDFVEPQLHLLSALGGTPLETAHRDGLVFDQIVSDMSYQGWEQDPADQALIRRHRAIFSNFYGVPAPALDRRYMKALRDFLLNGMERFHWLMIALHQLRGHIVDVFDEFRSWRSEAGDPGEALATEARYYASLAFLKDFLEFAECRYAAADRPGAAAIAAILEYERSLGPTSAQAPTSAEPRDAGARGSSMLDARPAVAPGAHVARLHSDYAAIIRALRERAPLTDIAARPSTVVSRRSANGRYEVIHLSAMSAALLDLCDGTRTVSEIAEAVTGRKDWQLAGIPPEAACLVGIDILRQQNLIEAPLRP